MIRLTGGRQVDLENLFDLADALPLRLPLGPHILLSNPGLSMEPVSTVLPSTASEAETVLKELERGGNPITAENLHKQMPKDARPSAKVVQDALDGLVASGHAYRYPNSGKAPRYWIAPKEDFLRDAVLRVVAKGPITKSTLLKAIATSTKGFAVALRKDAVNRLIKERDLIEWPKLGNSSLLSTSPPNPAKYLEKPLQKVIRDVLKRLEKHGFNQGSLTAAAKQFLAGEAGGDRPATQTESNVRSVQELIRARITEVEPAAAEGALVSLRDLRRTLDFQEVSKEVFDFAVLELFKQGHVMLHRHDYPMGIPESERNDLVSDGKGNFYVGLALRSER